MPPPPPSPPPPPPSLLMLLLLLLPLLLPLPLASAMLRLSSRSSFSPVAPVGALCLVPECPDVPRIRQTGCFPNGRVLMRRKVDSRVFAPAKCVSSLKAPAPYAVRI
ncbi:hypothetical protein PUN28_011560 [Cardiocondyla obscurior]|uniref:Secreted protein n=1 Tax=Cardiocondyla obscurior TaxID=286306 RepID=A0AAW2FIA4_9HYME